MATPDDLGDGPNDDLKRRQRQPQTTTDDLNSDLNQPNEYDLHDDLHGDLSDDHRKPKKPQMT